MHSACSNRKNISILFITQSEWLQIQCKKYFYRSNWTAKISSTRVLLMELLCITIFGAQRPQKITTLEEWICIILRNIIIVFQMRLCNCLKISHFWKIRGFRVECRFKQMGMLLLKLLDRMRVSPLMGITHIWLRTTIKLSCTKDRMILWLTNRGM